MKSTIVGLGREGVALARYLTAHGDEVTITDSRTAEQLQPFLDQVRGLSVAFALGGHPEHVLKDADRVYVSAGVRRDVAPFAGLGNMSSETQLVFERCPAPIVGITGSAGKTTTTTLIGEMLKKGSRHVYVGGNIGVPLIGYVDDMTAQDLVVLELSSFQLEYLERSPHMAVVTNITPNHLDRHPDMRAYIDAKANIVEHQTEADIAILNENDVESNAFGTRTRAKVLHFNGADAWLDGERLMVRDNDGEYEICRTSELQIPGRHNVDNVLAASLAALRSGISPADIRDVATSFKGVKHRLQLVREFNGVGYYNDSIATAPERTLAALAVFRQPIVLIAGGRDKHLPLEGLADEATRKVKAVVLLGEAAPLLAEAFAAGKRRQGSAQPDIHCVRDLDEAVSQASECAASGDVVLLSPACTSYDMFHDFEERGDRFVAAVEELK